jgi:hypothetical protein
MSSLVERCHGTADQQVDNWYLGAVSPYNDGWVASDNKKKLYFLRYKIDKLLKKCPEFANEDEWEKEIVFNILKEE